MRSARSSSPLTSPERRRWQTAKRKSSSSGWKKKKIWGKCFSGSCNMERMKMKRIDDVRWERRQRLSSYWVLTNGFVMMQHYGCATWTLMKTNLSPVSVPSNEGRTHCSRILALQIDLFKTPCLCITQVMAFTQADGAIYSKYQGEYVCVCVWAEWCCEN